MSVQQYANEHPPADPKDLDLEVSAFKAGRWYVKFFRTVIKERPGRYLQTNPKWQLRNMILLKPKLYNPMTMKHFVLLPSLLRFPGVSGIRCSGKSTTRPFE